MPNVHCISLGVLNNIICEFVLFPLSYNFWVPLTPP